ncbi:MAG: hypothetical protein ACHQXA_11170, partial [Gemmatimonadales bacterium]
AHTAGSPPALRARMREMVAGHWSVEGLARAAERGLAGVEAHPGDRSIALDLLAADGLITLALLKRSEDDPAALETFATALTTAEGR